MNLLCDCVLNTETWGFFALCMLNVDQREYQLNFQLQGEILQLSFLLIINFYPESFIPKNSVFISNGINALLFTC